MRAGLFIIVIILFVMNATGEKKLVYSYFVFVFLIFFSHRSVVLEAL
jgi:hypothetical protein